MPIATFNAGTKLGVEIDRATAPSSTHSMTGAGAPWWGGGRWFDLITDGLPNLEDRQATIFPAGHAGLRQQNQQQPVTGRKWSDGDLALPVVGDVLGALLYGAMGAVSSNMVPSDAPSLLNNEPIAVDPKSFVLVSQPDNGGNILRFDLKGGINAGTISVCGIDSYGNGASELVSFASAGLHYTRTSWSSIAASGIAISGLSAASVTVFGVRRYVHTFTTASSAPSFSLERIGTPTAGNATSKSFMHPGLVVRELTLDTPAAQEDGLFRASVSFEGDPTATCTAASVNAASPLKVWPAWVLQVTRDGGTAWNVPTNFGITIGAGNRNYRAAAHAQGPQGKFSGAQEITGAFTILAENEVEYTRWQGASRTTLYARWNTDWKLGSGNNYELGASLPIYYETVDEGDDDGAYTLTGNYRTVSDANWGIGQFQLQNSTPGKSYDGGAVI